MKRLVLALTATAFLGIAGTAEALTVSKFTAHADARKIHYQIHFCDGRGRIHEHFEFFALDRPSGHFTDDASGGIGGGCYVGTGSFQNRYLSGLWELKLTMSDSRGTLLHRSTHVFLP